MQNPLKRVVLKLGLTANDWKHFKTILHNVIIQIVIHDDNTSPPASDKFIETFPFTAIIGYQKWTSREMTFAQMRKTISLLFAQNTDIFFK